MHAYSTTAAIVPSPYVLPGGGAVNRLSDLVPAGADALPSRWFVAAQPVADGSHGLIRVLRWNRSLAPGARPVLDFTARGLFGFRQGDQAQRRAAVRGALALAEALNQAGAKGAAPLSSHTSPTVVPHMWERRDGGAA